ncbi:hypothetical protein M569_06277, partial [Genlisea aurea]
SSSDEDKISDDVDRFIDAILAIEDKSSGIGAVPDCVDHFSKIVEAKIATFSSGKLDSGIMESVRRVSRLENALSQFPNVTPALNQASVAVQRAMAILEEEFRVLIDDSGPEISGVVHKFASFDSKDRTEDADRCSSQRDANSGNYLPYSPETVSKMREIASTMISAGYETECCQVYYISRRNAIRNQATKLEINASLNMEDVARMPWESLEVEISKWMNAVKTCSETIFPAERSLAESVFAEHQQIGSNLLNKLIRLVVIQLLNFVEATTMAKRSAEKLFKFLDIYEALENLIHSIGGERCSDDLASEIMEAGDRIGESAASIFCDLENSIKSDTARTPVPGGAVHPLTRYVMNYLKYACEYTVALEKILANKKPPIQSIPSSSHHDVEKESESPRNFETMDQTTPFSIQVVTVMDLLDGNLEKKSRLYRDPSLRYIFLMNNGRYILQKVKGSPEVREVMGDTWCRRRSTVVRQYHKNYQRETWNRVLQCLNHDGLLVNGKISKPLLKERFKIFTATFEEIHRSQTAWVVSDEQLQSELRISVSSVLIPAYRSFVGRFRQYFDRAKQVDKYIKYQPEDIEALIEGLFEGNTASMGRKRT